MKLKNKKTGEIVEVESCNSTTGTIGLFFAEGRECDRAYNSLAELCEEWEDYEEPKEFWFIESCGNIEHLCMNFLTKECADAIIEIGNYFETEEEAEKAVEKLKAWKRLKDAGFKFSGCYSTVKGFIGIKRFNETKELDKDFDLLFGGEE